MNEPKIIGFLCTWCSYTGADLAGISRILSSPNVMVIRVPCSGRVSPELILRTFREGADGVMVMGCHMGDCHYTSGNHCTVKRIPIIKKLMEFTGIDPERLSLEWCSASEGERFAEMVNLFTEKIRNLPPINEVLN